MKAMEQILSPNGDPPPINWATILGDWSFKANTVTYRGGKEEFSAHGQSFPMGILVNDRPLGRGTCEVSVEFDEISPDPFAGGIILGYRSQDRDYLLVELGAGQAAYSVSEFVPGFGWRPLKRVGPRDALEAKRQYRLEVSLRGQELRASVDGVAVLDLLLSKPPEGKQTGLVAAGNNRIRFSDFQVASNRPRAFVALEYREPFDTFYREVIKPQAERYYDVIDMREKAGPGVIFQDMQREIAQADILIAEITPVNPNVFYELGYAQALGKPTILLAQRGGTLPFDIRSYRVVFYDDSIGGKSRVEQDLAKHLDAIHQSDL
jgi:hypothetical protein